VNFRGQIADVRSVLKDDQGVFITDDEVKRWLNEAQRDLAARLRVLKKSISMSDDLVPVPLTVGADSTIPLPDDFLTVHRLLLTNEAVQVNDDVWGSYTIPGATPGVTIYRIFSGSLVVYPDATGDEYTLEYNYAPADLVENDDISPLPLQLHPKMVTYARAQAHWKDGSSLGETYFALYEKGLPQPSTGAESLLATPLTLSFQRGPFDTADAAHI
jgi:hypothetical protein